MGAERYQWISMQIVAPLYPKCAISQIMKSQKSISNEFQCNAKQNVTLISKKNSYILVIYVSLCDKRTAIPQIKSFFLAFKPSVLFLVSFSHHLFLIEIFIWHYGIKVAEKLTAFAIICSLCMLMETWHAMEGVLSKDVASIGKLCF